MKKDKHETAVIFRMVTYPSHMRDHRENNPPELLALFPYETWDHQGHVASYARIGQHGGAHYGAMIRRSRLATPEEYEPLYRELSSIGYNLKVLQRKGRK